MVRPTAHLQGVHKVLDQEEAAHLLQAAVDVGQTGVHVFAERLGRDADILIYQRSVGRGRRAQNSSASGMENMAAFRLAGCNLWSPHTQTTRITASE